MNKLICLVAVSVALSGLEILAPMGATEAQARPSTRSFTCNGVRDYVHDRGAVVMNTKSSSIFRRFVANRSYCDFGKVTGRFRVPTKSGSCTLLICKEPVFRRFD